MESKRLSLLIMVGCLTVGTVIVGVTAFNRYKAAAHPGSGSALKKNRDAAHPSDANAANAPALRNGRRGSLTGAMFFPLDPATPAPQSQPPVQGTISNAASPSNPLADYAFTGFVTVDGEAQAVLEQRSTKQNWYVKAGDLWQNYRVVSVSPEQIVLAVDGQQRTLAMNDAFNAVPLLADAPFRKQQGAQIRTYWNALSSDGVVPLDNGDELQVVMENTDGIDTTAFEANAADNVAAAVLQAVQVQIDAADSQAVQTQVDAAVAERLLLEELQRQLDAATELQKTEELLIINRAAPTDLSEDEYLAQG